MSEFWQGVCWTLGIEAALALIVYLVALVWVANADWGG